MTESALLIIKINELGLEMAVTEILHFIGMPAHIRGYRYMREAILMAVNDPNAAALVTKYIYPGIAKKYGTSSSKVERAMRHALEIAWERGLGSSLTELIFPAKDIKPKNSEFIASLANWINITRNSDFDFLDADMQSNDDPPDAEFQP
jgi:two-component system response regulator (stage 0 sporulation protein A)